jgi:hypothetical protein
MKTRFATVVAVAALAVASASLAQTPRGSATTTVGGRKVAVDYGRPALKGRTIDALLKQLPPERIWRAGDSEVTIFSAEGDVQVGGTPVKAGKYSLYVHAPESGRWALVLNSDLGQPLGDIWKEAPENLKKAPYPYLGNYDAKIRGKEVARVELEHGKATAPAENFTISFSPKGAGATMTLAWGDQSWATEVAPAR